MNTKPIRIGIVGLGEHMRRSHIEHLIAIPNVSIIRWFDPNNDVDLSCFAKQKEQPIRSSFEEICTDEDINTVFIGSPDLYHAEQLFNCIQYDKNVFCEKPMACTVEDADLLKEALYTARQKGLIISSCHPRRFDPPFVWLKEKLSDTKWVEKHLGNITDFNFDFWYHEVTDEWKKDRSLLKDHFGHEIDLYRFLFSTTEQFHADMMFDSYDRYKVIGNSRNEDLPKFAFTGYRSRQEKIYSESITIKGTKDAMVMQTNTGIGMWLADGKSFYFPKIDYLARFALVNQDFINAIREDEDPYLSHRDMVVNNVSSVCLCGKEETYSS